jgi:FkbM family methyltransferase
MSHSQGGEEPVILEIFKDQPTGSFLDLGAFDGKTFSNTLALAEKGWSGVCVDASPRAFVALQETHKERPDVKLVCAAVSTEPAPVTKFYDCPDLVSSLDEAHKNKWEAGSEVPFSEMYLPVITVLDLFTAFGFNFDFINIDLEGVSNHVLNQILIETECRPKLICVEHDGEHVEVSNRCREKGYHPAFLDGNNIILERR